MDSAKQIRRAAIKADLILVTMFAASIENSFHNFQKFSKGLVKIKISKKMLMNMYMGPHGTKAGPGSALELLKLAPHMWPHGPECNPQQR